MPVSIEENAVEEVLSQLGVEVPMCHCWENCGFIPNHNGDAIDIMGYMTCMTINLIFGSQWVVLGNYGGLSPDGKVTP